MKTPAADLQAVVDRSKPPNWVDDDEYCTILAADLRALLAALRQPVEGINPAHRYLIKRNSDRRFVGSTDDLGYTIPAGHLLIDTIGEDGLGAGIPIYFLRLRKRAANVRDTGRGG